MITFNPLDYQVVPNLLSAINLGHSRDSKIVFTLLRVFLFSIQIVNFFDFKYSRNSRACARLTTETGKQNLFALALSNKARFLKMKQEKEVS